MMKRIAAVSVLVLVGIIVGVSLAQSEDRTESACTPEALVTALEDAEGMLAEAKAAASEDDTSRSLELIAQARDQLAQTEADCGEAAAAVVVADDALCDAYPQFCVPLTGAASDIAAALETPDTREVEADSAAVSAGVVRGVTERGTFFIGNPDAPVRLAEFADFACPHCIDFHDAVITPLIEEAVLSGQATLEVSLLAFVAGEYSQNAAYAMLCAGEQGAAWEVHEELYARVKTQGAGTAYTLDGIRAIGDDLGLDSDALVSCVESGRYAGLMAAYDDFAQATGVTGTPTVLISYGDSGEWNKVENRGLDNLLALVEAANAD